MKLDSEQKRVLKAISGSSLGFMIGYPLLMWIFGKLDSWRDVLIYLGVGLIVAVVMGVFYVLGAKIPKKDDDSAKK
jgi:biotin transporter BioY